MTEAAFNAKTFIQKQKPNFTPKLGLILGSGLSEIAASLEDVTTISYGDIPGFIQTTISGHAGVLSLGYLNGVPTVCLQGRKHYYEGFNNEIIKTYIRTLKLLGVEILFLTNAAGSLHQDVPAGSLMMITDHINFQGQNPLIGSNDEAFGPRFFGMEDAYDPKLRDMLATVAKDLELHLAQGVYISALGPMFETPAEIRAFRLLGADAVGMSTVPEVIAARHCGLRVVAVSAITNLAAGMNKEALTHEDTLYQGAKAAKVMQKLIFGFTQELS